MNFDDKLHEEILQTLERRSKIDMTKLTFLTTLFGIGTIGKITINPAGNSDITLYGTVYIAPFVALICDCFTLRELWSIRRIGAFLCLYGEPQEQKYERFVSQNRNIFYRAGFIGLTFLTIVVASWMLTVQKGGLSDLNVNDYVWFGLSILFWVLVDIAGWIYLVKTFDKKNNTCDSSVRLQ